MFKNHPSSEKFFSTIEKYLSIYRSKIENGVLKESYINTILIDEASNRPYYIDKSLEKQMVLLLKNLCSQGNHFMQDYVRDQTMNYKTFNLVQSITNVITVFTDHLHFPVVYEIFIACLECLFELIQGPNKTNQMVIIMSEFTVLANNVLLLEYKEGPDDLAKHSESYQNIGAETTIGYRTLNLKSDQSSMKSSTAELITQPKTNFHISLAKYHVAQLLNHLLDGFQPSEYVYFLYRRELDPHLFRLTFAYQKSFMMSSYRQVYTRRMFFNYGQSSEKEELDP